MTTAEDEIPVACTLGGVEMPKRLADWRQLLARASAREQLEDGVRIVFGAAVPAADVAELAAAEQGCCAFFRFAVTIDHRGIALEVRAPDEAQELVAALFG